MGGYSLKNLRDDALLLGGMGVGPALGWTGPLGAANVAQVAHVPQLALDEIPGAHVLGLFLQPDELVRSAVLTQRLDDGFARERIQLFDANQRDVIRAGSS